MDELRILILKFLVLAKLAELPEKERQKKTDSADHFRDFVREVVAEAPAELLAQASVELIEKGVSELFKTIGRQVEDLKKKLDSGDFDLTLEFPEIDLPEGIDLDQFLSSILDGL